jgi:NTP pyrophosphatase (non-canonical NTP hydrolase)
MKDDETTVQQLKDLAKEFRDARGWEREFTPKNLSMSIAIEAAELMEHFQWNSYRKEHDQDVVDELADILAYCMQLAVVLNVDVANAYRDKLERAAKKYPVELFNPERVGNDDYERIKREHRKQKGKS